MEALPLRQLTVRFFGGFRGIAGKGEEELALPERATLRMALEELGGRYGPAFRELLWAAEGEGQLSPFCALFADGEPVSAEGLERAAGSELKLFLVVAVAGG